MANETCACGKRAVIVITIPSFACEDHAVEAITSAPANATIKGTPGDVPNKLAYNLMRAMRDRLIENKS